MATPSSSTPVVWVAATVAPMVSTWRAAAPRRATTVAAINVLPWPGASAWNPPSTNDSATARRASGTLSRWSDTSRFIRRVSASAPRDWGRVAALAAPAPAVPVPAVPAPPGRATTWARSTRTGFDTSVG